MTEQQTLTLADFLLARIAEDEAAVHGIEHGFDWDPRARESRAADERGLEWINPSDQWSDTYRLDVPSDRILAECEAKRRIVELANEASGLDMSVDLDRRVGTRDTVAEPYVGDLILRALALPYADHADYRDEWRA
jgi:hypothetical protein